MAEKKKKRKVEFSTPERVINVVKAIQDVEDDRASDRAKINSLFNGQRPYTAEEVEQFNIQVNVNWGEGKKIMRDANSQLNNALIHPGTLFTCTLRAGQVDKRDAWGQAFTQNVHIPLQEGDSGRKNYFLLKDRNASVCLHGIGAMLWGSPYKWMPRFVPMEDLLIPTETKCDFSNLRYFAVNLYLTIGELFEMAKGPDAVKGWNQEMVEQVLEGQKDLYNESTPSTWRDQPEAMRQIFYENAGYYYSDAVPKVRCVQFFWQEMDEPNKWYRVLYLKENIGGKIKGITKDFLFDGTAEPFADNIGQILNVQYGDSNFVPPMKYHLVRGLGIDLYAPIETLNRLRCELVQAAFENMKMYFRIKDPADRDRAKQQILQQYGFIVDGLEIVPPSERHQIDAGLVENAMGQMSDILQQSSSSFVTSPDSGGEKTMTAKEAMIKVNEASALVSAMLATMYLQEGFYYTELVRRFLLPDSLDPQVKEFRRACKEAGIPDEMMDIKHWKVTPEQVMGGGDKTLAQQQAQWLLSVQTKYGPQAQQTILRMATSTMLDNPSKALMLVPEVPPNSTLGSQAAESVFGTLMTGNACALRNGIDYQGYVTTLLKMMGAVIQRITQTGGVGTIDEIIGLQTVAQNAGQYIGVLSADPSQKQLVKQYGDVLGKMLNMVKAFGQRWQQQQQAAQKQQQGGQADAGKAQSAIMMAKVKGQIAIQNSALKRKQKELDFALDQQRQNLELVSEMKREDSRARQEALHEAMSHTMEVLQQMRLMQNQTQQPPPDDDAENN